MDIAYEPWYDPNPPYGLHAVDFVDSLRVLQRGSSSGRVVPAPITALERSSLYGADRAHNQLRIEKLWNSEPIRVSEDRMCLTHTYAGILIPDPTHCDDGAAPVGASAEVGYIGSVYGWSWEVARDVEQQLANGIVHAVEIGINRYDDDEIVHYSAVAYTLGAVGNNYGRPSEYWNPEEWWAAILRRRAERREARYSLPCESD